MCTLPCGRGKEREGERETKRERRKRKKKEKKKNIIDAFQVKVYMVRGAKRGLETLLIGVEFAQQSVVVVVVAQSEEGEL